MQGDPSPKPRPGRRTSRDGGVRRKRDFRCSDAEWAYMQDLAVQHETTVSELIRDCLLVDMPAEKARGEG